MSRWLSGFVQEGMSGSNPLCACLNLSKKCASPATWKYLCASNDMFFKCQEGNNSSHRSDYYMTKLNRNELLVYLNYFFLSQWHRLGGGGAMGAAPPADAGEGPPGSQDCGPGGYQGMLNDREMNYVLYYALFRSLTKQVFPSSSWRTRTLK